MAHRVPHPGPTVCSFLCLEFFGAFLSIGGILLIFLLCNSGCRKRGQGIVTALIVISVAALLKSVPSIYWLLIPAVFVGTITRSSLGFYIGALLQLALGAWLLCWFSGRARRDGSSAYESASATGTAEAHRASHMHCATPV